jgi:methyl-accepting chemotaxis protein/methyl-accepting chemotaxis protein-1 (serine sensor receptor)
MKTLTIGNKIAAACGALVALTVLLGGVSIVKINQMNGHVESMTKTAIPGLVHVSGLAASAKDAKFEMMSHIASVDPEAMRKSEATLATLEGKFQTELSAYKTVDTSTQGREILDRLVAAHGAINGAWVKVRAVSREGKTKEAIGLWDAEVKSHVAERAKALEDLIAFNNNVADGIATAAMDAGSSARLWGIVILLGSVATGGLLAFFVVRGINGVLTQAINELSEGAEQVSSASGQVSGSSQSLAQGASEQAASLEETSASSEEMSSMTRKNSVNSQQAATLMNAVSQRVEQANQTLADMTTSMEEIGASSSKISKIIKVIDEIAFQTNILALNAAVEAARAGEAGMGFAVVADEVRNLAQRSAQAAKDTAALIEDSIEKSAEGRKKLGEVAGSIQGITEGAGQVKMLVDEVEASSKEQAQGIEQISKAVSQMDEVTQRTAANAEETASASEQLSAQSQALMAVVAQLQAMVGGASGESAGKYKPQHNAPSRPSQPVQKIRSPRPSVVTAHKPAMAGAGTRRTPEFPLDDSEFKEF